MAILTLDNGAIQDTVLYDQLGNVAITVSFSDWVTYENPVWKLLGPMSSSAVLAPGGAIDQTFTPDVPGRYLVQLVVDQVGTLPVVTETFTALYEILDNRIVPISSMPAPGEKEEYDPTGIGWAYSIEKFLQACSLKNLSKRVITVYNTLGGNLAAGTLVEIDPATPIMSWKNTTLDDALQNYVIPVRLVSNVTDFANAIIMIVQNTIVNNGLGFCLVEGYHLMDTAVISGPTGGLPTLNYVYASSSTPSVLTQDPLLKEPTTDRKLGKILQLSSIGQGVVYFDGIPINTLGVKLHNGEATVQLDELLGVNTAGKIDKDTLFWDTISSTWISRAINDVVDQTTTIYPSQAAPGTLVNTAITAQCYNATAREPFIRIIGTDAISTAELWYSFKLPTNYVNWRTTALSFKYQQSNDAGINGIVITVYDTNGTFDVGNSITNSEDLAEFTIAGLALTGAYAPDSIVTFKISVSLGLNDYCDLFPVHFYWR